MNIWPFVSPMCTGPAEVPMMSPNGSIPPIHVPPGYISQVSATFQDNIINKYVFGKGKIVFYYFYYSLSIWKEGIKKTIIDSQWKSGTTCHMSIHFTLHLNDTTHYKLVVTWACACKCACGTASIFWGKKKNPTVMPTGPTTSHPLTSVNETCGLSRALTSLLWSIRHYTKNLSSFQTLADERSNQYVASADLEWALQTLILILLMIGQTWKQTPDQ